MIAYIITSSNTFLINVALSAGSMILVLTTILGLLFGPKFKDIYLSKYLIYCLLLQFQFFSVYCFTSFPIAFLFEKNILDGPAPTTTGTSMSGMQSMASMHSGGSMASISSRLIQSSKVEYESKENVEVYEDTKDDLKKELERFDHVEYK